MKKFLLLLISINAFSMIGPFPGGSSGGGGGGSGTVTSVAMSVPTFLSVAGSPITSSGTLAVTLSGTALPVANGGTGATALTANNVLLGNGTSAVQFVAPGTSGNVLTSNGTTWTSATPAAGVTGSGTSGQLVRWTGTGTVGNSNIAESSTGALTWTPSNGTGFNMDFTLSGTTSTAVYWHGNQGGPYAHYIDVVNPAGIDSIGQRVNFGGTALTDKYTLGFYATLNANNSGRSFSAYNGFKGNIGFNAYVANANAAGGGFGGVFGTDAVFSGAGVYGYSANPRAGANNKSYGVRGFADMSNSATGAGGQFWIGATISSALEALDMGASVGLIASNGDTTGSAFAAYDNTTKVFDIQDGGVTVIGQSGGSATHRINSATVAAAANTGTLTNFPVAGNPSLFLKININGTNYFIPAWTAP